MSGPKRIAIVGASAAGLGAAEALRRRGYDARIQAYGIFPADADITLMRGELAGRRFVVGYSHRGRVVGVLGWNSPRQLRTLRQLVVDAAPSPSKLTAADDLDAA